MRPAHVWAIAARALCCRYRWMWVCCPRGKAQSALRVGRILGGRGKRRVTDTGGRYWFPRSAARRIRGGAGKMVTGGRGCRRSRPAATRSPAGGDCCLLPNRMAACRPGDARQPRQRKPVHGHDHRCARGRYGHENEPRSDRPDTARVRSVNPMSATSAATTLRHDARSARPEVVAHRRAGRVRGRSAAGRVAPTRDGRRSRCHTKAHTTPASPNGFPKAEGCRAGLGCRRSWQQSPGWGQPACIRPAMVLGCAGTRHFVGSDMPVT